MRGQKKETGDKTKETKSGAGIGRTIQGAASDQVRDGFLADC